MHGDCSVKRGRRLLCGLLAGMGLLCGCIPSVDIRLDNQTPGRIVLWQLHSTGDLQRIGTAEPHREVLFPQAFSLTEQKYVFIVTDDHEKVTGTITRSSNQLHREIGNGKTMRLAINRDMVTTSPYQGKPARELMKVGTHEIRPLQR